MTSEICGTDGWESPAVSEEEGAGTNWTVFSGWHLVLAPTAASGTHDNKSDLSKAPRISRKSRQACLLHRSPAHRDLPSSVAKIPNSQGCCEDVVTGSCLSFLLQSLASELCSNNSCHI